MRYGVHYGYWAHEWDADVPALCKRAHNIGLEVLEIGAASIRGKSDGDLAVIKEAAALHGIELVCGMGLPSDKNIAAIDPDIRDAGIDYLKEMIILASKAGIHKIAGILYASWFYDASKPVYKNETRANSIENMKLIADFAKKYDVTLMMEVCNRFATYMLNTAEEAVRYVKEVGKDNVKIMLDTFHMNIEEDSFGEAIRKAGNDLGYIHICENNRKLPGQGHLPWEEIVPALTQIRFNGPAVFESFVNMKGTIAHDLKIWRELRSDYSEEGKDLDLRRAIDFLEDIGSDGAKNGRNYD